MILEHLSILEGYIRNYRVDAFEQVGNNLKIYVTIHFKNASLLYIKEILIRGKRKYAYHWQDSDESLICRWDNAPDWPDIETYPHHKHFQEELMPSYETEAKEIFKKIKEIYTQPQT